MSAAVSLGAGGLRRWVKQRRSPLARLAYGVATGFRDLRVPVVPSVHRTLYALHTGTAAFVGNVMRILWWTPLFASRLKEAPRRLYLDGGMPQVLGPLRISIGEGCRISGLSTLIGRTDTRPDAELVVGRNVDIGWQTTIAVGDLVQLGDNVRLAGRCFLAGFPGHPVDAAARAAGLPDTRDQIGPIVLEDDVWLATGVTVTAGVRIGRGTIVAAGSVVTKDLPEGVLAGGVPARVIRSLEGAS